MIQITFDGGFLRRFEFINDAFLLNISKNCPAELEKKKKKTKTF